MSSGSRQWPIFVALAGLALGSLGPVSAHAAEPAPGFEAFSLDYLIQNVCLDGQGNVLAGSTPLSPDCTRQRDLRPGERLPYHKSDWPNDRSLQKNPNGWEESDSFPVVFNGQTFSIQTFQLGVEGHQFLEYSAGDGGQIAHITPYGASLILTEDGHGLKFFYGPGCDSRFNWTSLDDSWLLFQPSIQTTPLGHAIARLTQTTDPGQCPRRLSAALTIWDIRPIRYRVALDHSLGPALTTIVTDHFSQDSIDRSGSMERMYLTRELGWTRWERWQNLDAPGSETDTYRERAGRLEASGRCAARAAAPESSKSWVLVDCREFTNLIPSTTPGGETPDFWIGDLIRRDAGRQIFQPGQR